MKAIVLSIALTFSLTLPLGYLIGKIGIKTIIQKIKGGKK